MTIAEFEDWAHEADLTTGPAKCEWSRLKKWVAPIGPIEKVGGPDWPQKQNNAANYRGALDLKGRAGVILDASSGNSAGHLQPPPRR